MNQQTQVRSVSYWLENAQGHGISFDFGIPEQALNYARKESLLMGCLIRVMSSESELPVVMYLNGVCYEPKAAGRPVSE